MLLTNDLTPDVVSEAIQKQVNVIVSYRTSPYCTCLLIHPLPCYRDARLYIHPASRPGKLDKLRFANRYYYYL